MEDPVRIRHRKLEAEAVVGRRGLPHWRKRGWEEIKEPSTPMATADSSEDSDAPKAKTTTTTTKSAKTDKKE